MLYQGIFLYLMNTEAKMHAYWRFYTLLLVIILGEVFYLVLCKNYKVLT